VGRPAAPRGHLAANPDNTSSRPTPRRTDESVPPPGCWRPRCHCGMLRPGLACLREPPVPPPLPYGRVVVVPATAQHVPGGVSKEGRSRKGGREEEGEKEEGDTGGVPKASSPRNKHESGRKRAPPRVPRYLSSALAIVDARGGGPPWPLTSSFCLWGWEGPCVSFCPTPQASTGRRPWLKKKRETRVSG
jgi:hypothetical protein